MSMEREKSGWKIFQLFFLSLLQSAICSDFPSQGIMTVLRHFLFFFGCIDDGQPNKSLVIYKACAGGCYWTDSCMHKWWGDCGGLVYNQSEDCYGHCRGSPCPLYHTRFFCCKAGSPRKVEDGCTKCDSKVDYGDEFVCCSDCSDADMVYSDSSSGYCKTGAELIVQSKPREVFKWVTSTWLPCSSTCGGGVRTRRVECYSVIEDTSTPDYPVYDDKCSNQDMPAKQEPCNLQACAGGQNYSPQIRHPSTHNWLVIILVLLGLVAVCAVVFAGYIFYMRRSSSSQHGHVYIMLEGYT